MAADYAALEARVTELERIIGQVLPARIDAVSYGLTLVHQDTQAILAAQAEHGRQLGEILHRLPPPPGEAP